MTAPANARVVVASAVLFLATPLASSSHDASQQPSEVPRAAQAHQQEKTAKSPEEANGQDAPDKQLAASRLRFLLLLDLLRSRMQRP